ncbi:MAG: hypothetical protein WAL97_04095, partial [Halobacteriota archaeon]
AKSCCVHCALKITLSAQGLRKKGKRGGRIKPLPQQSVRRLAAPSVVWVSYGAALIFIKQSR